MAQIWCKWNSTRGGENLVGSCRILFDEIFSKMHIIYMLRAEDYS